MKHFLLPIEERDENLDRACEIVRAEAAYEGSAYTLFRGVPLIALSSDSETAVRDNWQKLFEQFQASPEGIVSRLVPLDPEPETPVKRWHETWWGKLLIILPAAVVTMLVVIGASSLYDVWEGPDTPPFVVYESNTDAIVINVDEWKKLHGCSEDSILETSETGFGGPHGNTAIELRPYCVPPSTWSTNFDK